ncbi:unnamed protein product [Sphagnum troendelagicum]|uniref:Stomatal closure-related actin-binding protein 1 n=1 Tax=Sphagnum troendelagicum TaxID=128251 RepID=A0ABP0V1K3_9BRYO
MSTMMTMMVDGVAVDVSEKNKKGDLLSSAMYNIEDGDDDDGDDVQSAKSRVLVAKAEAAELESLEQHLSSIGDLTITQFETIQAAAQAVAAKLAEEEEEKKREETVNSSKEVKSRYGYQCSSNHTHHHGQNQHQQQQTHAPRRTTTATKNGPGDGALPSFRSSLRRTSGNLRDCEKNKLQDSMVSMDLPSVLKKLRTLLGGLAGRVAGRNKDDAAEALSLVEVMKAQWIKKERELEQEKENVRKQAALFKQASDDARKMMEKAQSNAHSEIEAARATVLRVEASLMEHVESLGIAEKQELEEMRKQIIEARRIKMLHEPSKTMDMEFEIQGLRQQLTQKTVELIHTRKELVAAKRTGQAGHFQLQGEERLGASLTIAPSKENDFDISKCTIQWHRESADGSKHGRITGANRPQYAPEPFDVGWVLRVEILLPNGKQETLLTSGPLDAAPGLGNYVEALFKKGSAEFDVRLVQQNGEILEKPLLHVLLVEQTQMKLFKGRTTKAKEDYSSSIWLCGARGAGQAAVRSLYWVANKGLSLMLVLESERERNAAILLARRFASNQNVTLLGPDDGLLNGNA